MFESDLAASFAYRLGHVVRLALKREMSNGPSHFPAPVPGAKAIQRKTGESSTVFPVRWISYMNHRDS